MGRDFPGGPVIKNLSYSSGGAGSIPGKGTKIPCKAAQLKPQVAATEPVHPGARTTTRGKSEGSDQDSPQPKIK